MTPAALRSLPPTLESLPRRIMKSRYHDFMAKQTTVRLPDELADQAEAVARVKGSSVNALIVESLEAEIERVRADKDFTARARKLLQRDKELLDRLAR
jgi:predicted DNA-binding protein